MTDQSIQTTQLPVANGMAAADSLIALVNTGSVMNTCIVTLENVLSNSVFDIVVANNRNLTIKAPTVPLHANSNGSPGMISWSGNSTAANLYLCVANNSWFTIQLSNAF